LFELFFCQFEVYTSDYADLYRSDDSTELTQDISAVEFFYSANYSLTESLNALAKHRTDLQHINLWDTSMSETNTHIREMIAWSKAEKERMKRLYPDLH
jgi:hypothetical protein